MIQVIPKETGLPSDLITQVSVDVMTFNTENVKINTYYQVFNANRTRLLAGNLAIDTIAAPKVVSDLLIEIEDEVLAYLTLVRL